MARFTLLLLHFLLLMLSSGAPIPSDLTCTLRSTGYSLSAAVLSSASHAPSRRHRRLLNGWNATGTLFLPIDSAFKDRISRLPSASVFLYHAARLPLLRFSDLSSLPSGSPIPTFSRRRCCLFVHRTSAGELCLGTSYKNRPPCIKILHPDIYFDGDLVVHGVDGALDPATASGCYSGATWRRHSHLDHAVRVLRRKGFSAVAGEVQQLRADLAELQSVTIFAHRGHALPQGYDLRRHVAPRRYRVLDLTRMPEGTRIATIAANSTVAVRRMKGGVTVNGIAVDGEELFRNGWAVVLAIQKMFPISDDVADQVSDAIDYTDFTSSEQETDDDDRDSSPSPSPADGSEEEDHGEARHGAPAAEADDDRRRLGEAYAPISAGSAPAPSDEVHVDGSPYSIGTGSSGLGAYELWWDPL